LGAYRINIIGLSNRIHHFQYEFGDEFFEQFDSKLVSEGNFHVNVALDKRETFLDADFEIRGVAKLACDRTLEPFDYPIDLKRKMVFKYGDRDEEITDEITIIQRDTAWLELGQYIYEFIALAIPIKKLHPRFQEEAEDDGLPGKIVYSSSGKDGEDDDDNDSDDTDPRWNILKKLK
jgi:uncharacterized metal-binding protein YceD (DUF177 family)